ncbi:Gfo/Idh/MocA family protein [Streptomyces sp. WMMC940]|uniref:Gfo/Idh/MocA family protein n=1 Tax=Streptomyces sp. WMMC940 TaxID=3015153 RepID=UPI0022B6D187|nr:Gfo/Idh/MocA family oxidoreductase [Streptomyces sp. WMMC940]MCZ7456174.1 Gfo/Idh/MocA family oxidoreductase [Streptomyces sp. WMMC940]
MSVGVGIVGFGSAGRQHATAMEGLVEAHAVAVLEQDPAVDTAGLPRAASWSRLLADPEIDMVALCLPPGGRAALAVDALEAGKAVLLEKPPAVSVAEIDLIAEAARRSARPVGVMLQHRMRLPASALTANWADPAVTSVLEVSRFRPPAHYRRAGWRGDPASALGGIAAHLGVHYLDLACQLLGRPEAVRLAPSREFAPGIDTRVTGHIVFRGGATLALTVTAESAVRSERLQVLGPAGGVCVADGLVTTQIGDTERTLPGVPTAVLRRMVYQEMAEAVATGCAPLRCHLEGARAVTEILTAVAREPEAVA